eukprot:3469318-Pleurochrysis_carterae.AAC.1
MQRATWASTPARARGAVELDRIVDEHVRVAMSRVCLYSIATEEQVFSICMRCSQERIKDKTVVWLSCCANGERRVDKALKLRK